MFSLSDYDYDLPEDRIAQKPRQRRDTSRLLCLQRQGARISHHRFGDVQRLLAPGDVLVLNNTEVIPGRLLGRKQSGGRVEVLILDYDLQIGAMDGDKPLILECLVKASKRPRVGAVLVFDERLSATVTAVTDGRCRLKFNARGDFESLLYKLGRVPLPPYIHREVGAAVRADDRQFYQTVYAARKGAIAAPTAGLHFTSDLLAQLQHMGVQTVFVTLHVGYGTFAPVRVADIRTHRMHCERFSLSPDAAATLNRARKQGQRIIAVGSTSMRTLEFAADATGIVSAGEGQCDLFIYPGYRFKIVDALITNFHLPRSTLLMLVAAFAGLKPMHRAYAAAIDHGYRFYSYGDSMLII